MKKLAFLILLTALSFLYFQSFTPFSTANEKPVPIPPSQQRSGNALKGYKYLTEGDYVKGGIPYEFTVMATGGKNKKFYLQREGLNGKISHEYTVVTAPNGEKLAAPNCMQCHAQVFDSVLYIGMGNTFIDFSLGDKLNASNFQMLEKLLQKQSPSKYEAAKNFITVSKTIGPKITTAVRGVNSADRLAAVLAAHRDPVTFKWQDTPILQLNNEVIPSDVPAWWLLKKKNAMFYNGFGRGDFGKFLMASNLLTVNDTAESREVDSHISDVLAYIYTLEPPKYPKAINASLAKNGEALFIKNCSKCHGEYGKEAKYPNLLVPESIVKTDSLLYQSNYQYPQFIQWFNSSWFATGKYPARLEPFEGYIAPPLDGIWVTAPYLHNASVPTLDALLNSKTRPAYWSRDFNKPQYDYEKIGWQYTVHNAPGGTTIYNTTLPGYGNYGHTFGDKLSDTERKAVIEYLKTL
jgi:mono/diheme cytochrome c family protein